MQIRELDLKELYTIYDVLKQSYTELTYEEFENIIYDMRYMEYKMIGVFEKGELVTYAGVCILTTIKEKRHLKVFDFVTSKSFDSIKYDAIMKEYLLDFARVAMCEKVIY